MPDNSLKITPDFVVYLILKYRWVILMSFFLAIAIGLFRAVTLPKIYEAHTMIFVDPQSVPQNYVRAIVTEDAAARISTIAQQILSRSNLEKIIKDFGLFNGNAQKDMFMEDKVALLRKAINVEVDGGNRHGVDAFSISFKGKEPETVARVANGLASYFINENLKVRETQAMGTSDFLDSQLSEMRSKLEKVEEKIKEYRKTYMGELPEQLETNLRILDQLQGNLTNRQNDLRDAKIRLAELKNQTAARSQSVVIIGNDQGRTPGSPETASLDDMRHELEILRGQYTDKHPDIIRLKKMIAEAEERSKSAPQGEAQDASRNYSPQVRARILDTSREIELAEEEIESIKKQIAQYAARVEATPKREQELLGLRRDYQNIQAAYESLLSRKLEAGIAVDMERKQKGEQFRIIDPARVPQRPSEPDLKKLLAIFAIAGLAIGGGLSFGIEFLRASYRKPEEIESFYDLPVIATIPTIYSPRQLIWRSVNAFTSLAFSVVNIGLFAIFAYICITGGDSIINAIKKFL